MSKKKVEAIYPLSPQQQGMLFEALAASEAGIYIEQNVYDLNGGLNLPAFQRAWQRIVERHSVLRTAFVWKDVNEPLQAVLEQAEVPLEEHDWRELRVAEQREKLESYLASDRMRGFELMKAPLMRLSLIRTGEITYHFVWTLHHILMDGWCLPVIAKEFSSLYQAFGNGQDLRLAPSRPYRDYVAWLKRQDFQEAEAYWRARLEGFIAPIPLGSEEKPITSSAGEERYLNQEARLSAEIRAALQATARRHRLTMNTLVQGVWALLLSRYSGEEDVVFGTTVSGRPPELESVETMIGLFINTLPFRVKVLPDASLWTWLEELQTQHLELRHYEYCSTGQVHQWSAMPGTLPLYESLIVYENYPAGINTPEAVEANGQSSAHRFTGARTAYPLTLLISTGTELVINAIADGSRLDKTGVSWIIEHYFALLRAIAFDSAPDIATLLTQIPNGQIPAYRSPRKSKSASSNGDFVTPRTQTERVLAGLAAVVLGLERVSLDDNFFSLGGHSLLVMQLLSRVRDTFHIEMPLRQVFESPTVAGLAESIDTICWAARGAQMSETETRGDYEDGEI